MDQVDVSNVSACCPGDSHGAVEAPSGYENKGTLVPLRAKGGKSLELYVTKPEESTERAVMVLHDIFGTDSGRTKQICDDLASQGYVVVMPNLVQNEPWEEEPASGLGKLFQLFRSIRWINGNKWSIIGPLLMDTCLDYLKGELGCKSVGLICFCWGCYPMVHMLSENRDELKCGIGFHPSLQVFLGCMESRSKYCKQIQVPIMSLSAKPDPSDIKPNGLWENDMKESNQRYGDCVFREFTDMLHGWVNRGDLSDPMIKRDFEESMSLAKDFLDKHV
mmetsp:Transcript_18423/g.29974  ORF Transcript_18423/g.29974 Transcript_18423/m.29974 type:complete len:277 (-) Transcript_18423:2236-3066(-)